jgi:hypothetical protein
MFQSTAIGVPTSFRVFVQEMPGKVVKIDHMLSADGPRSSTHALGRLRIDRSSPGRHPVVSGNPSRSPKVVRSCSAKRGQRRSSDRECDCGQPSDRGRMARPVVCLSVSNRFLSHHGTFPPWLGIAGSLPLLGLWVGPGQTWQLVEGLVRAVLITRHDLPIASRPRTPCSVHQVFVTSCCLGWRQTGWVWLRHICRLHPCCLSTPKP